MDGAVPHRQVGRLLLCTEGQVVRGTCGHDSSDSSHPAAAMVWLEMTSHLDLTPAPAPAPALPASHACLVLPTSLGAHCPAIARPGRFKNLLTAGMLGTLDDGIPAAAAPPFPSSARSTGGMSHGTGHGKSAGASPVLDLVGKVVAISPVTRVFLADLGLILDLALESWV